MDLSIYVSHNLFVIWKFSKNSSLLLKFVLAGFSAWNIFYPWGGGGTDGMQLQKYL